MSVVIFLRIFSITDREHYREMSVRVEVEEGNGNNGDMRVCVCLPLPLSNIVIALNVEK